MVITICGFKLRLELIILMIAIYWIMAGHLICSCSRVSMTEGFEMAAAKVRRAAKEGFTGIQFSSTFSDAHAKPANMNSWYQNGSTPSAIDANGTQPIPLPNDEMVLFATTKFKPECCPSSYSTSTGCACMTNGQYKYLQERGGNNVPYSEY